ANTVLSARRARLCSYPRAIAVTLLSDAAKARSLPQGRTVPSGFRARLLEASAAIAVSRRVVSQRGTPPGQLHSAILPSELMADRPPPAAIAAAEVSRGVGAGPVTRITVPSDWRASSPAFPIEKATMLLSTS